MRKLITIVSNTKFHKEFFSLVRKVSGFAVMYNGVRLADCTTKAKALIVTSLALASMSASAMTEYETKMLAMEEKRLELAETVAKESILTGKAQRCIAYKSYSIGSLFNAPEDCSFMVKAVDPSTVQPTPRKCNGAWGC